MMQTHPMMRMKNLQTTKSKQNKQGDFQSPDRNPARVCSRVFTLTHHFCGANFESVALFQSEVCMSPFRHIWNNTIAPFIARLINNSRASIRKRAMATWLITQSDTPKATTKLQRLTISDTAPSTIRVIAICGLSRQTHFNRAGSEQALRQAAAHDPRQHCRITALFRLAAHGINPRDVEHVRMQDRLRAIAQLTT